MEKDERRQEGHKKKGNLPQDIHVRFQRIRHIIKLTPFSPPPSYVTMFYQMSQFETLLILTLIHVTDMTFPFYRPFPISSHPPHPL
jgi:hypothetical protein